MASNVLIVPNAYEALRYKKRYPTLLDGAKVVFVDDIRKEIRIRNVHVMYYTPDVPLTCPVFSFLRGVIPPVALSMI